MSLEKFHKIDLHIHTPSSKCFKGNKNDEEYIEIIKKAIEKDIRLISITDHNTISGYRKLFEIKTKYQLQIETLQGITDSDIAKKELKKILEIIKLFDSIVILPGIELEVKPGIHILLIFDDKTDLSVIENIIFNAGYDKECFGDEVPFVISKWDLINLFDELKDINCLVIDAHTDSNKGIYKTLEPGNFRAKCFSSERLNGICYKSEKEKDKIVSLYSQAEEYKRINTIPFLKFSDAHSIEEIGSSVTWARLENIDYGSLKNAFENPVENISTDEPLTHTIINKLLNEPFVFCIDDDSEDNIKYFKKAVCALNNTEVGFCIFGITKDYRNKTGILLNSKDQRIHFRKKIDNILKDSFDGGILRYSLRIYPLQNNKYILTINITQSNNIIYNKEDLSTYIIDNNNIKILDQIDTQKLIIQRQMFYIEGRINSHVEIIERECSLIRSHFSSFPIIKKIEYQSSRLLEITSNKEFQEPISVDAILKLKIDNCFSKHLNGMSSGNLCIINSYQLNKIIE